MDFGRQRAEVPFELAVRFARNMNTDSMRLVTSTMSAEHKPKPHGQPARTVCADSSAPAAPLPSTALQHSLLQTAAPSAAISSYRVAASSVPLPSGTVNGLIAVSSFGSGHPHPSHICTGT